MKYTILVSKGAFPDIQTAAHAEEQINWWDDGQVAEQTVCTLSWTATELAKYLPGEVEILDVTVGWTDLSGTVILLGTPQEPAVVDFCKQMDVSLPSEAMPAETLRMVGCVRNGVNYVLLTGADRVGVMYGAFAYLERLGVHFLEPGDPSYGEACTEAVFDITESPSYTFRGTMSSFIKGDDAFYLWMAHNRFNAAKVGVDKVHYRKKLGINRVEGGHEVFFHYTDSKIEYPYCHKIYGGEGKPADPYPVSPLCTPPSGKNGEFTYGDAHPEWYALYDGERQKDVTRDPAKGWHAVYNMCTSNKDMVTELCRLIVEDLAEGRWKYADHLHVWPLDGGKWCECEECQKQGNYSTRLHLVAYQLDKAIKQAYREGRIKRRVRLVCCAYHETLPVPDKPLPADYDYENTSVVFYTIERCYTHNIDDPICVETNQLLLERLSAWCDSNNYKGDVMIGEYYNVSSFAAMPFVLTSRILNDIPAYYRMGARSFHYMHISGRDWGFIAINNYIHGKLLWNVNADGEALVNTYFTARYGSLAPQMRALYEQMEKVTANCKYYKHYQYMNGRNVSLKNILNNTPDVLSLTEDKLFPTKHMQFRGRADDPQAGPSMEETVHGLDQALEQLLAMKKDVEPEKMLDYERDVRRLKFGCNVTRFIYLLCLSIFKQATEQDTQKMHDLAEQMATDTESMMGYDTEMRLLKTALDASWVADVYRKYFAKEKSDEALSGMLI